jgi:hypothetical protein
MDDLCYEHILHGSIIINHLQLIYKWAIQLYSHYITSSLYWYLKFSHYTTVFEFPNCIIIGLIIQQLSQIIVP